MIDNKVHDQLNASFMHLRKHAVKILHCSELLHDCPVIADIVSIVIVW